MIKSLCKLWEKSVALGLILSWDSWETENTKELHIRINWVSSVSTAVTNNNNKQTNKKLYSYNSISRTLSEANKLDTQRR